MKKTQFLLILAAGLVLTGCDFFQRKHLSGIAVELNGHALYWEMLDSLTMGLSSEDSMRVADRYIRQWATDILEYDKATDIADNRIEALVEDYRRSLYVHAYETMLVERRMSTKVPDSVVVQIYEADTEQFMLRESILKGVLLVMPQNAPHQKRLRRWLETPDENIEDIEKYAYRYASGYELFTDHWLTAQQILFHIPVTKNDFERMLKQKTQIEISDSTYLYILQVTDKHLSGQPMPIDYARPEIEKTVLRHRQVDFLQNERDKLYDDAILFKKIHFFEREN